MVSEPDRALNGSRGTTMFSLETIKSMNDAAALKEQFPEHDCTESDEVDALIDERYVDREEAELVERERDILAGLVRERADELEAAGRFYDALSMRRTVDNYTIGQL